MRTSDITSRLRASLQPRCLIRSAIVPAILLTVAHLLGWREYTGILCGTREVGNAASVGSAFLGLTYILLYLLTTILSPILATAAALLSLLKCVTKTRSRHR